MVLVEVEVSDEEEAGANHSQENKSCSLELENSDNAVEALDVQDQFINNQSEIDTCSNTAQFPEDSNGLTNEPNSFRGTIHTEQSNESNEVDFNEVIDNEFGPIEMPVQVELEQEDTTDSQSYKTIRVRSQTSLFGEKEGIDEEDITGQSTKKEPEADSDKNEKSETMDTSEIETETNSQSATKEPIAEDNAEEKEEIKMEVSN